jgi:SAM-dependent methyltransferase
MKATRKIAQFIDAISTTLRTIRKLDSDKTHVALSPIERYILLSYSLRNDALFHHSYDEWKMKRISKILALYDIDWFKNRKVLELGCGHGDIGAFLASLGANVLALDGRKQNVNFAKLKHRKVSSFKCIQFNLEKEFSEFGHFDVIINFGLLYHLKNVDEHLRCCFKIADDILFETVVCDSTDPHKIFFCDEDKLIEEEALEGTGCRPSPFYVERLAEESGFEVIRHFSRDLNSGDQFVYDWEHKNDERLGEDFKLRRFWRFKKRSTKQ